MIILIDKDSGYFRAGGRSDVLTEENLNKFFGLGSGLTKNPREI